MNDYGSLARHKWAVPFEILMTAGAIITLSQGNVQHFGVSLFTLAISFAPLLIEWLTKVRLPAWLQALYVAFIFASMFSGEVLDMYARYWPWDDIMHAASGFLIGMGGVVWLTAITSGKKAIRLPIWLQSVFVFCLVSAVVLLWEFAEFGSDQLFGTTSQGDLFDTMLDLLFGAVGGLVVSVLLSMHLYGKRVHMLDWAIKSYVRLNS